jgi:hypothetical protein
MNNKHAQIPTNTHNAIILYNSVIFCRVLPEIFGKWIKYFDENIYLLPKFGRTLHYLCTNKIYSPKRLIHASANYGPRAASDPRTWLMNDVDVVLGFCTVWIMSVWKAKLKCHVPFFVTVYILKIVQILRCLKRSVKKSQGFMTIYKAISSYYILLAITGR